MIAPLLLPPPAVVWSEDCPTCEGTGLVRLTFVRLARTCPTCRGARVVLRTPLLDPPAGVPRLEAGR